MGNSIKNKINIALTPDIKFKKKAYETKSSVDKPPGRCIVHPPESSLRGRYFPQQSQPDDGSTRGTL